MVWKLRAFLKRDLAADLSYKISFLLEALHVMPAVAVFGMSLVAFSSVGIMSASFTLIFRRGDPVLWLFGSASWLLGGVLFPTSQLPRVLRSIATLLPITHAANAMRAALLTSAS